MFLVLGDLPWRPEEWISEPYRRPMERAHSAKLELTSTLPVSGAPPELGSLLQLVDISSPHLAAAMAAQEQALRELSIRLGIENGDPLDWTHVPAPVSFPDILPVPKDEDEEHDSDGTIDSEEYPNSYHHWDIADWDMRRARDKTLTFPVDEAELLDCRIPEIAPILGSILD
jgi:hypothetical protein